MAIKIAGKIAISGTGMIFAGDQNLP